MHPVLPRCAAPHRIVESRGAMKNLMRAAKVKEGSKRRGRNQVNQVTCEVFIA